MYILLYTCRIDPVCAGSILHIQDCSWLTFYCCWRPQLCSTSGFFVGQYNKTGVRPPGKFAYVACGGTHSSL